MGMKRLHAASGVDSLRESYFHFIAPDMPVIQSMLLNK